MDRARRRLVRSGSGLAAGAYLRGQCAVVDGRHCRRLALVQEQGVDRGPARAGLLRVRGRDADGLIVLERGDQHPLAGPTLLVAVPGRLASEMVRGAPDNPSAQSSTISVACRLIAETLKITLDVKLETDYMSS